MRAMHEHPVPDESKEEKKTKRCNECDEEFFPVHNLFRLRLLLGPATPQGLHRKTADHCRFKFLSASRSPMAKHPPSRSYGGAGAWRMTKEARTLKCRRLNSRFNIRISSFLR